jgi:ABC-2 type transport system permease protein
MKVFFSFAKRYFKLDTYYQFEFYMQLLRDFMIMYAAYCLWNALFNQGIGYVGATREQVLTYGVFGAIFTSFVTRDGCQNYISKKIRDGVIDTDLLKPIGLQRHMFIRDLSQKLSKLLLVTLPSLVIFILLTRLFFVVDMTNLLLFFLSGALAYIVLFAVNFLFGMICFFTLSIESISFAYASVVSFLAGQMVPLWLFPDWAQKIINLLPFRCIFDIPMSIYIGRVATVDMIKDIGLQLFWAVTLIICGNLAWKSVRSHIISQGG